MKYSQAIVIHMMNEYAEQARPFPHPTKQDMNTVFSLCRRDDWVSVLKRVQENPWIAMTPMIMDNSISTTILHQAITSKGDTAVRAQVILQILTGTPMAASIKNGYGSLPLHVIAQRNTKMIAETKGKLIFAFVKAYKGALMEEGGVGKRTPLHIIFTDYVSPEVTGMMIDVSPDACFMKDKNGYLPAHVACSRHCSPVKLQKLLSVNPSALYERTETNETLLSLAKKTATKSHPNYALIHELNHQLAISQDNSLAYASLATPVSSEESDGSSRGRLDSNETVDPHQYWPAQVPVSPVARKRKSPDNDTLLVNPTKEEVDLLCHFSSRNGSTRTSLDDEYGSPSRIAQV